MSKRPQFMVSIEFLDVATHAGCTEMGAWLRLSLYCAKRFNGGRIGGSRPWDNERWLMEARVRKTDVDAVVTADLCEWGGDDLVVLGYDLHGEDLWSRQSSGGKAGAEKRWSDRSPSGTLNGSPSGTPIWDTHMRNSNSKGNGKEAVATRVPARPAAADPSQGEGKPEVSDLLAEFGLRNSPKACKEWAGGINRVAKCRSLEEARAFLRWALARAHEEGLVVEHWRHVKALAENWNDYKREELWKPQEAS